MKRSDIYNQDGYRYIRITSDDAYRVRMDVQLYSSHHGYIQPDLWSPSEFRIAFRENLVVNSRDYHMWDEYDWFLKLDDVAKPEYEG